MAKLSISQAWEESRAILARDGKLISTVALAMFVLPGIVLNVIVTKIRAGDMPGPAMWIATVAVVLLLLVSLTGQLSIIRLALGPHVTVRDAIAHGARRLVAYLGAVCLWIAPVLIAYSILYNLLKSNPEHPSLLVAVLLLLVSLTALIIAVRLLLLSAVASAEDENSFVVLRRTWELTRGNWWRLFGFMIIFGIAALALLWATDAVLGLLIRLAFGTVDALSVGGLIVIIISQLISGALSVVLFVMLARLYAQRAGAGAQVSVPSSGI